MDNPFKSMSCWVVTEGLAGTENQCVGVAEALGVNYFVKRIKLREPWKTFSPMLGFEQWWTFDPQFFHPLPDLVIASGRKSIAASRYIKKISNGKTFTLQIQDPRTSPQAFDLVAVPFHDSLRGSNVIVTTAAPNRITESKLERAKLDFKQFSTFKKPTLSVMVGGHSKTHKFTKEKAQQLCEMLLHVEASLLITLSRRTPKNVRQIIEDMVEKRKNADTYLWNGEGENPYFAYLAYADYLLITSDSASMISEAATTGKPVYKFDLEGSSQKFNRFYKKLETLKILRNYEGRLEKWDYEPLRDAEFIAKELEKRMFRKAKNTQDIGEKSKPS